MLGSVAPAVGVPLRKMSENPRELQKRRFELPDKVMPDHPNWEHFAQYWREHLRDMIYEHHRDFFTENPDELEYLNSLACSPHPRRVAVTGGIGSGKTTLAQAMRPYALAYADADQIAREIVEPGQPALKKIAERFGKDILFSDGSLNRAALAEIVFADPAARADLESITHPLIAQKAEEILNAPTGQGFVLYDIPLLRTAAEAEKFDEVILVTAPLHERVDRLAGRGLTREGALARINSQITDEERATFATQIVANDGTREDLHNEGIRIARSLQSPQDRNTLNRPA